MLRVVNTHPECVWYLPMGWRLWWEDTGGGGSQHVEVHELPLLIKQYLLSLLPLSPDIRLQLLRSFNLDLIP